METTYFRACSDGTFRVWTQEEADYDCFRVYSAEAFSEMKKSDQIKLCELEEEED